MVDMLARLFALPEVSELIKELQVERILIRRAHPAEKDIIVSWIGKEFNDTWSRERQGAIVHRPPTCFIATEFQSIPQPNSDPYNLAPEKLIGFGCYDAVAKGMFGPTAVHPGYRGRKIGKALLLASLHAMADDGYGYAVIPWVGPIDFYRKTVGATIIEDSEPGIFRGSLIGNQ